MIQAKNLYKNYGDFQALKGLSMTVNKGDIYGFIGPNGAGKSTTFKILATILKPNGGTAKVDGNCVTKGQAVRHVIGYMPDTFGVYDDMTVRQYLDFFGAAYYIPAKKRKVLINDILELTDLTFKEDAMVQSLSRGMQQRLGVARVLVHDPRVLILDEPASGLDPRARIELRELLKELSNMGKTILISSHILSELSEICTRVGIIEQGEIVFEGSRDELNQHLTPGRRVIVETHPEDLDNAKAVLDAAEFCATVTVDGAKLQVSLDETCDEVSVVASTLVERGIRLRGFKQEEVSLEQAFIHLTQGKLA
jgi:ABC-2 type transport system ATP-binding protein